MAFPQQTGNSDSAETYRKMEVGDVEAIGAHCQMPFCRQLDLLPFKCQSCGGKYCLDHRTETAHQCSKAGEWGRRRAEANRAESRDYAPSPRPSILTHEQQCSLPSCKTLIDTPLVTGVQCDKCNYRYCLKHRFTYDHDCANLKPRGARPTTQKERGLAALEKLKAWGASKKVSMPQSKAKVSAANALAATAALKRTAKGDDKIPQDKRVYLYVEASSDTLTAKIPKGNFFYSSDYSVGRVLDIAAKGLQVQNINNRSDSEEDKLRVFHVEGGRLLDFSEKLGQNVQTGNTVVLLRGVGASMAKTPDQTF